MGDRVSFEDTQVSGSKTSLSPASLDIVLMKIEVDHSEQFVFMKEFN